MSAAGFKTEPGSEDARLQGCICDPQCDRPAGTPIRVEKACAVHGLAELFALTQPHYTEGDEG